MSDTDDKPKKSSKTKSHSSSTESSPSKTKKPKVSHTAAQSIVLDYLTQQNRPFNVEGITTNLSTRQGGGVPKADVLRICDALSESGELQMKEVGKSKVYYVTQHDVADPSEAGRIDAQCVKLQEQLSALKSEVDSLERSVNKLKAEPTDAEYDKQLKDTTQQLDNKQSKLTAITSGKTKLLSQADIDKVQVQFNKYYVEWKKRRKMFNDITGGFGDEMDKKQLAKCIADMGVDTDEDNNVKVQDYEKFFVAMAKGVAEKGNKKK